MKHTLTVITLCGALGFAAGCGKSTPSTPTTPTTSPGADVTISITGINGSSSYSPSPTTVNAGQRVIFRNTDPTSGRSHNAVQDANAFSTANLASGASSDPITMSTRGTFAYHCSIHPSMVGTITVQ